MSKVLQLIELYRKVQEAFDFENIEEKPIKKVSNVKYVSEDKSLEVVFQHIPEDTLHSRYMYAVDSYNVLFTVKDTDTQAYKTDYKEFISILKSVKTAVEDFIKNIEPDVLVFLSIDKMGTGMKTDPQKDRLYQYAIMKNLPSGYGADYDIHPYEGLKMKGIILFNQDLQVPYKEETVKYKLRCKNKNS